MEMPADKQTPKPAEGVDDYFAACYRELRRMAHARLRQSSHDAVLDTTMLVHESYLKLARGAGARFPDRPSFLAYAGRAMRSIIVDMARERQSDRRGNNAPHLTLTGAGADALPDPGAEDVVLRVHEALDELAKVDPRMAQVVELKYFGGLLETEVAQALGVTDRTVRRDWEQARLLLATALKS
jgi:RNA polymerase sigma factor (TIGR02999 family)